MRKLVLAALAAILLPGMAQASAFTNGGFETVSPNFNSYMNSNDSTAAALDSWIVTAGNVDFIGSFWQAGEGGRSLDMDGLTAGTIAQTFDTVAGTYYNVGFLLSGNPLAGPAVKSLLVSAGANVAQYDFDTTGRTRTAMGWTQQSFGFTATGNSTTLTFASNTPGAWGAALDGVSVTAVPEPATWAMMIGGLAIAGGAMRRRRSEGLLVRA